MIDVLYGNRTPNRSGGEFRSEFLLILRQLVVSYIDDMYDDILKHDERRRLHTYTIGVLHRMGIDKESNTSLHDAMRR